MIIDKREQKRKIEIEISLGGFKLPLDEVIDMYLLPEIIKSLENYIQEDDNEKNKITICLK